MTEVWDLALASTWQLPLVWIHGDIAVGNLLVNNGQLCAVIDFGQLGWTLVKKLKSILTTKII